MLMLVFASSADIDNRMPLILRTRDVLVFL